MDDNISKDISDVFGYYVAGVMDVSNFGIAIIAKTQKEEPCTIGVMEALEGAKRGFMKIKRDGYVLSDFRAFELNNGFYNVRDFLQSVCSNVNLYLGGIFDVDIEYKIYEEDNVNINFDGKLVEKAMYDAIFGLLCEAGVKKRRVSVYSKDLSKHIKICMRCEGACPNSYFNAERKILLSGYGAEGLESYAEIAMQRLGGKYKCVYSNSDGKVELYIPKNLKLTQMSMKEEPCKIILGEKVMVHKVCDKTELDEIFGALKNR